VNLYQEGVLIRRLTEAKQLWAVMKKNGFTSNTSATLDFTFFSDDENRASNLVSALLEHCKAEMAPANAQGYWLVTGTTRPDASEFDKEDWFGWVEFMVKLGFANNSVFSTWSVCDSETEKVWSSEDIDIE